MPRTPTIARSLLENLLSRGHRSCHRLALSMLEQGDALLAIRYCCSRLGLMTELAGQRGDYLVFLDLPLRHAVRIAGQYPPDDDDDDDDDDSDYSDDENPLLSPDNPTGDLARPRAEDQDLSSRDVRVLFAPETRNFTLHQPEDLRSLLEYILDCKEQLEPPCDALLPPRETDAQLLEQLRTGEIQNLNLKECMRALSRDCIADVALELGQAFGFVPVYRSDGWYVWFKQNGMRAVKIHRIDRNLGSIMDPHPTSKSVAVTGLKIGAGDSTIEDLKRGDFSEYHLEGLDPAALYLERTIDVDYLPKNCVMFNLNKEGALHALMQRLLRHRAETIELLRSQPRKPKPKLRKRANEAPKTTPARTTTSGRIQKPRQRARSPPLMKLAMINNAKKHPKFLEEDDDSASSSDEKKPSASQLDGDEMT